MSNSNNHNRNFDSEKIFIGKRRNPYALAASMRNSAGPMKDKRQKRGGARNERQDFLSELDET